MNLNQTLIRIKEDLLKQKKNMILVNEPNEKENDIDLLVQDRSRYLTKKKILLNSRIPIYFYKQNRCFAYYISKSANIKGIDLFDFPSLTDNSIKWLISRSIRSKKYKYLNVINEIDRFSYFIYKTIKKNKISISRYKKIIKLSKIISRKELKNSLKKLLKLENENKNIILKCNYLCSLVYKEKDINSININLKKIKKDKDNKVLKIFNLIKVYITNFLIIHSLNQKRLPIICFLGIDGSGKTSKIKHLSENNNKIDSKIIEFKKQNKSVITIIIYFFIKILKKFEKNNKFYQLIYSRLYFYYFYFLSTNKIQEIKKYNKNKIIYIDRWWIDFFAAPKNKEKNFSDNLLNKFLKINSPDIILFNYINTKKAIKLRPKENIDTLELKQKILKFYLNLYFNNKTFSINSSYLFHSNIKKINKIIYLKLREGF